MHPTHSFPKAFVGLLTALGVSAISSFGQTNIPVASAVGPALTIPGGSLKGEYWFHPPAASIPTDGLGNDVNRIDRQITRLGAPTGTFSATVFEYSGNDLSAIHDWLGADGASYSGINSNLDDGAIRISGFVNITAPITIGVGTTSDDGSRVKIGGVEVINNDNSHGDVTVDADVTFSASGLYPIEITYFNGDWTSDGGHNGSTNPGDHGGAHLNFHVAGANVTPGIASLFFPTNPYAAPTPTISYNFNDGLVPAGTQVGGNTPPLAAVGDDGTGNNVLKLTTANNSLANFFYIPDPVGGKTVGSLKASWKSFIGGGGGNGADGYSFNWGADVTPAAGGGEEGSGTGLSVTIDTFDNGNGDADGGTDRGLEIKWKGSRVNFKYESKDRAVNPSDTVGFLRANKFVDASVLVDETTGQAVFTYDTVVITAQLPGYHGIAGGNFTFAGRTGGANDNQWIDNLVINESVTDVPATKLIDLATTTWRAYTNGPTPTSAGVDLAGTGWEQPGYNDSAAPWWSGVALFGQETTPAEYTYATFPPASFIPSTANGGPITVYFRTHFNWSGPTTAATLIATNLIDDSAVWYLNGVEVSRIRVPAGQNGSTYGDNNGTEGTPEVRIWDTTSLHAGDNVVAVELHNTSATSSDDVFGLDLVGQPGLAPAITDATQPTNRVVQSATSTTLEVDAVGAPALTYQWYLNGAPIDPGVNPTATSSQYVINSMSATDAGEYYCVVSNILAVLVSRTATVDYFNPTSAPTVINAVGSGTFDSILIEFDEPVDPTTASDLFNYAAYDDLNNPLLISAVTLNPNGRSVLLTLDPSTPMAQNTHYNVLILALFDVFGNLAENLTAGLQSWVSGTCNGVVMDVYRPESTSNNNIDQTLLADPNYPNSPNETFLISGMDSRLAYPDDSHEGYGARMRGIFIPPTSGKWRFYIRSDDSSRFFINPAGPSAAGKQLVCYENGCCNAFLAAPATQASKAIALTAGHGYYMEAIYKEGTGGDYCQVAAALDGDPVPTVAPTSQIQGSMVGAPAAPGGVGGPVNITTQPADVNVNAGVLVSFSVAASNDNGFPLCYQWRRDNHDGSGPQAIAGANLNHYGFGPVTLTDNGASFDCVISVIGGGTTSSAATLHVTTDVTPPSCVSAAPGFSLSNIVVRLNEFLDPTTANDAFNYSVPGFTVLAASLNADASSVQVTVDHPMALNTTYSITLNGVTDLAGNPNSACTLSFKTPVISCGFALQQLYMNISGGLPSDTRASPNFPDRADSTTYITSLEGPLNAFDNYGTRISGYLIPPKSGNYNFFMASDDGGEFLLSSDENPANLTKLCFEPAWNGSRQWTGDAASPPNRNPAAPENQSSTLFPAGISMTAGQKYYFELVHKEGGGGDNCAVAWQLPGGPVPANGSAPIGGAFMAALANPTGASVTITQQPTDQVFLAAPNNLLNETFNANNGGFTVSTPAPFDGPWVWNAATGTWQENGQGPNNNQANTSFLNSPVLHVTKAGGVTLTFQHRWTFEFDGTAWDGGQVRMSVNGSAFHTVSNFVQNGYNGAVQSGTYAGNSDLIGQVAYISSSAGYDATNYIKTVANLGNFNVGDTVQVQWMAAADSNTQNGSASQHAPPAWEIDQVVVDQGAGVGGVQPSVFSVGVNATPQPVFYQWYRDDGAGFQAIPGANGSTYSILPACADNGAHFRVNIYTPGALAVSTVSTLVVTAPNSAPLFGLTAPPSPVNGNAGAQSVPSTAHDIKPGTQTVIENAPTIGLNFGADEPTQGANAGLDSMLADSTSAGVVPQLHWNNLTGNNGSASGMVEALGPSGVPTVVSVTWSCPNTWASTLDGEENNQFPAGGDRTLMTGYLDTDNAAGVATVNVSGLGPEFTAGGYDVIVYALGGTSANRWGAYSIGSVTQILNSAANPTGFVLDTGVDTNDLGNYAVFAGQTDSSFTLIGNAVTAIGNGTRAPINAIQIVAHQQTATPALVFASTFDTMPPGAVGGGVVAPIVDSGHLVLTANINSQNNTLLIPLGSSSTVPALKATWKTLIDQPGGADGYSLTLGKAPFGATLPPAGLGGGEDGASPGLSVSVDTYNNGAGDAGLDIWYNGANLAHVPVGPGVASSGSPPELATGAFVDTSVELTADGHVTFQYASSVATATIPGFNGLTLDSAYFWARTGNANENCWIDDLRILGFAPPSCGDESGQIVHFNVSNDNPGLFSVQPAIDSNGTLTYTPSGSGGTAHVTVVAQDNGGTLYGGVDTSAPQTFSLVLNGCPTATGQSVSVAQNGSVAIQLVGSDPEGGALTYNISSAPAHGTVTLQVATGAATYAPATGYTGSDSFAFTVTDGSCVSAPATVHINVGSANHCPTPAAQSLTVPAGGNQAFQLVGSDADGDALTFAIVQPPLHGVVTVNVNTGAGAYTPAPGYTGPDSFAYSVSDGHCTSPAAVVSITVIGGCHTPPNCVAHVSPAGCGVSFPGDPNTYVLSLNGSNGCVHLDASASTGGCGNPLSFLWKEGGATLGNTAVVPACLSLGCHTLTLTVTEASGGSCTATLVVCVIAPSDAIQHAVDLVDNGNAGRKNKRPIIASLKAAQASFDRGDTIPGLNQLQACGNKVRAQLDPPLSDAIIAIINEIVGGVGCPQ